MQFPTYTDELHLGSWPFTFQTVSLFCIYFFKHQRQMAQATYMPVKSTTMNILCMLNNDTDKTIR